MFLSQIRAARKWWQNLSLQLSWKQLPPLTSHSIAFLAGTLLLRPQPNVDSAFPQKGTKLLVPAERILARSKLKFDLFKSPLFTLVRSEGQGGCRLSPEDYKIWASPGVKPQYFLQIPHEKAAIGVLRVLLEDKQLILKPSSSKLQPCTAEVFYD